MTLHFARLDPLSPTAHSPQHMTHMPVLSACDGDSSSAVALWMLGGGRHKEEEGEADDRVHEEEHHALEPVGLAVTWSGLGLGLGFRSGLGFGLGLG